jgi:hypothetical protein
MNVRERRVGKETTGREEGRCVWEREVETLVMN